MFGITILLAAALFSESKPLAVQIGLDRLGYSCGTIDGCWGGHTQIALARFAGARPTPTNAVNACALLWPEGTPTNLLGSVTVTQADIDALCAIPESPADKEVLESMGYETLLELYAERAHTTQHTLKRLNPGLNFDALKVGQRVLMPIFPRWEDVLREAERDVGRSKPRRARADVLYVSLKNFNITAFDKSGAVIATFPCSIAKNKAKLPPRGALKIVSMVPRPNYTYTPDHTPKGKKVTRYIFPPGPNNPVGVAWIGLSLPGYGIHGTPLPERIGRAESHGCFRLANWNAARLYALCHFGTRVVIGQ